MINFLHSELKPKVSSSCVCEDNYEASNLITSGPISQGFMAFSVIKPPINLTFEFPSAIEIHKIKIWSSLGSLKSTGFEIKIKNNNLDYIKVAHVSNLLIDDVVTFCRHPTSSLDKQIQFFTYKLAQDILNETTSIIVTIKSSKKCPPVIRKIEIWGLPARSVSKGIKENIHRIWDEILYPRGTKAEKVQQSKIQKNTTSSSLLEYAHIPEEFLDQITCEIMIFPMTLPSGKLVDQSTIEKHSHIEEKWGRLPSDPFTGQIFTNIRKPLLNLALKSRIERYLLENSNTEAVQLVPRTLGKSITTTTSLNKRKIETFIPSTMDDENNTKRLKVDTINFTQFTQSTLETDIKSALKNITRYSQPLIFNSQIYESCINCNMQDNLYKITTCKHIICKICLNTFCQDKICSCKTVFKTSDVEKYNI